MASFILSSGTNNMSHLQNITLCLTIGKRPYELRQTLESLLSKLQFSNIIAINDFGDEESNNVFHELCPHGKLIDLGYNLGHHKAIDYMYERVETPYVLHCEDDWVFDSTPNLEGIINFLQSDQKITMVCLRKISDMEFSEIQNSLIINRQSSFVDTVEVHHIHDQWYGYSFNPHIASLDNWKKLKPFSQYKKERHISRSYRRLNCHLVYLQQGSCEHIGFNSVANPEPLTWLHKLKNKISG